MAIVERNNPFQGTDARYRGLLGGGSWTLCVGAGVSIGLVPTWQELTRRVVNSAFGVNYDDGKFQEVLRQTRWGLDALLQGAANRMQLDGRLPADFETLLEKALYEDIITAFASVGLDEPLIEALNNPRWLKNDDLNSLCEFFEKAHPESTLIQLARCLARAVEIGKSPRSVINFNADTLLYALLDIFLVREHRLRVGRLDYPAAPFIKSLRGAESRNPSAIAIYHCHGAIVPVAKKGAGGVRRDSRDHLVFREREYLDLAGSISTWAQSIFLFHAQCSRLVIVGHSLSDPNIRRWLGWSHSNAMKEFEAVSSSDQIAPRHIWIAQTPADKKVREIQEVSLLHLGIRVCWVDAWLDIERTLENLLAL